MFVFLVGTLREWAVTKYGIVFENDHDASQLQYQPEEVLAEIVERVNRSAKDILEEFGLSWLEEIAAKRFSWQLEVLGLSDFTKERPVQSLSSLAAITGTWRQTVESLFETFPGAPTISFWWSDLKQEGSFGEEYETGVFHLREEGGQVSLCPFFTGLLRSLARIHRKSIEIRPKVETPTSSPPSNRFSFPPFQEQELFIEWRESGVLDSPPSTTTASINSSPSTLRLLSQPTVLRSPSGESPSERPSSIRSFGLEADELSELFPFHMVFKGIDFRIVQLGDGLTEVLPKLQGAGLLSQAVSLTTTSIYGETVAFDPSSDPNAASKFSLVNVQLLAVTFKGTGISLRGKIRARERANGQETIYFFLAKPMIPPSRLNRRRSEPPNSISSSPLASPSPTSENLRPGSPLLPSMLQSNSSLGFSLPLPSSVLMHGLVHDELIDELLTKDVARTFFYNSIAKRSSLSRRLHSRGNRKKGEKRKSKNRTKERSRGDGEQSEKEKDKGESGATVSSGGRVHQQLLEVNKALAEVTAERKSLELALATARIEATAESRATSAFLAHMSHEIRTPLNGILGMSQLLLDSNLDPQQRDTAETIQTSGQQLLTIVNDILDFEKIQAGCLTLEIISFDLRKVVEESCEMLSFQSNSKHLETVIHYSKSLPRMVKGDPGRFRQILLNFLNNAIKFTEEGHIRVICEKEKDAGESVIHLKVTVEDTGIGIPEDRISRLFKSFSQVDTSITRKYGGTGLGLVISQQLVELMGGGEIVVKSKVGSGSSFTFTVPLKVDKDAEDKRLSLPSKVFMVIEHNDAVRKSITEDLLRFGAEVVTAGTVPEAEQKLRSQSISLIFSTNDVAKAPVWLDLLEKWHRKSPVVLLHSSFDRLNDLQQKSFMFLSKPVKMRELEYLLMSELGLLSEADKQMISGRRRKSIKLSRKFSMGKYSVLLVDDNPVNLKVASRLLERLCIKPDCVCSGQEALECAKRKQYDVILMDLCMPGMNGYEATAELRNLEGDGPRPAKVIAITADATTDDRLKCLASGMDDFVSKPLTLEKLADVLDRILCADSDSPLPSSIEAELGSRIPFSECM